MPTHHSSCGVLVAESARIGVGGRPRQFLSRAVELHAGLAALAPGGTIVSHAAIFLASWCLELALKAHLANHGLGTKALRPIQHNLAKLWIEAANHGLSVSNAPPRWCIMLSETHDNPYFQRYPSDSTAAYIAPNINDLVAEIGAVLDIVGTSLQ